MIEDKSLHFAWVYAADGLHLSALLLIIGWILHKRTCKGISGRSQIIEALVNFLQFGYAVLANKNFYKGSPDHYSIIFSAIGSTVSAVLLFVMYGRYKKTIEKDYDTFWIEVLIILSGGIALVANPVYMHTDDKSKTDPLAVILYTSIYLEAVSILPQIYFNFRTGSKTLCMSLYVLLSTLSTFFLIYYLVTAELNTTDIKDADVLDKLNEIPKYTIYPEIAELGLYALFFFLLVIVPKYEKILPLRLNEVESTNEGSIDGEKAEECEKNDPWVIVVTRPQLDRQQSLLEAPFLKKTLPSSTSLVSTNPDGTPKPSPLHIPKNQSKPRITRIMKMKNLKRARTSASSLFILGAASAPSTPEDEGFMMFKETALQSRKRRQEYNIRRRSLPTTSTLSCTETALTNYNNLNNEQVKFMIGDDDDYSNKNGSTIQGKHRKTSSFERFLAAQKLKSKHTNTAFEKNICKPSASPETKPPSISNKDDQLETMDYKMNKTEMPGSGPKLKPNTELTPKAAKASRKVSDGTRKKSRRATVYHPGTQNPHQMNNNWKMLATNFLGTGPIEVRRPSVAVLPSRDEQMNRRRDRIFSV